MSSPDPVDLSLRAIALIRAVNHGDQTGVTAAVAGLAPIDVLGVAMQTARITGQVIDQNLTVSVDEVCDRIEDNVLSS